MSFVFCISRRLVDLIIYIVSLFPLFFDEQCDAKTPVLFSQDIVFHVMRVLL